MVTIYTALLAFPGFSAGAVEDVGEVLASGGLEKVVFQALPSGIP